MAGQSHNVTLEDFGLAILPKNRSDLAAHALMVKESLLPEKMHDEDPILIRLKNNMEHNRKFGSGQSPFFSVFGVTYVKLNRITKKIIEQQERIVPAALQYKQHVALDFMERMIRTEAATDDQLNRFLTLLSQPENLGLFATVIPELQLDKSVHFDMCNHMITRILQSTHFYRPILPYDPGASATTVQNQPKEETDLASTTDEADQAKMGNVFTTKVAAKEQDSSALPVDQTLAKEAGANDGQAHKKVSTKTDEQLKQSEQSNQPEQPEQPEQKPLSSTVSAPFSEVTAAPTVQKFTRLTQVEDLNFPVQQPMSPEAIAKALDELTIKKDPSTGSATLKPADVEEHLNTAFKGVNLDEKARKEKFNARMGAAWDKWEARKKDLLAKLDPIMAGGDGGASKYLASKEPQASSSNQASKKPETDTDTETKTKPKPKTPADIYDIFKALDQDDSKIKKAMMEGTRGECGDIFGLLSQRAFERYDSLNKKKKEP